ncbi:MAG: DUF4159 domain-containing protein [Flavobacteriaceae bacterium]|jgi:hypothetical protein|uniref:DUF4159 domain-containing protein n=1 Tax=Formosa sp. Hel3_A1_48 TaxID=1336795 RepID=UPI00084E37B0|nr:DUF4159 domain-containing protein [Formosa sp. Hel3_A1_48]MDC0950236.1 DUF4159 domain-containing protein [Flavobacteriaceae bacterium]CAI8162950.1 MAG: Uncharacterised protein [Formosa sp. Hel3_A1_48]
MRNLILIVLLVIVPMTRSQGQTLAVLKYDGGGDWYSNPTALKNLIQFSNTHGATKLKLKPEVVHPEDPALFSYPFIHMTGHGNVVFSDEALKNLNTYLIGGGFLHIDDNYGMKPYILPQLKKLFPSKVLKEVPSDHPIFNLIFEFPDGLPKIHEHDGLAPQALGIFHENRLILLCTFESDLSDGWEDQSVHKDPEDIRLKALQMGANIIKYAFEF